MIRYDKNLNKQIQKTVKNFNQKISRLEKMGTELLPQKISAKTIKQSVTTRTELNKQLKNYQSFSKRGSEKIIKLADNTKISYYEMQLAKKKIANEKRKLTLEINALSNQDVKIFGKKQAGTFLQMGDDYLLNLIAKRKALNKNLAKLSKNEIDNLIKMTNRSEDKSKTFQDNYINELINLAKMFNFDKNKLSTIVEKLKNISPKNFYKLYNEDKAIKALFDYYTSLKNPEYIYDDVNNLLEGMSDNIDNIVEGYV